jgi:hypothetical protein
MMLRTGALLSLALIAPLALAQLTEAEQQGFDDALLIGGLRRSDFSYDRYSFPKPRMLPLIDQGISSPFDAASALMKLHASGDGASPAAIAERALYEGLARNFGSPPPPATDPVPGLDQVPLGLRGPVARLVRALRASDVLVREALKDISPKEQRELIEALPRWAVDQPSVKFDFVRQPMPTEERLGALLEKLKPLQIHRAGWLLSQEVEASMASLKEAKDDVAGILRVTVDRMVIEIAGRGADVHKSSDARLVIDLGGDDSYQGRAGAGIGYSAVVIDLGGDDRSTPKDAALGSGLLGVGIARFVRGNDRFSTGSLALGSGIGGVGIFVKEGGSDSYSSSTLSQGFGLAGLGLLIDTDGTDTYDLSLFGQGAGRWFGLGWLVDQKGRDIYRAGGFALNSPLFETAHYSFAQGFGMGHREDTGGRSGGIGLLTDLEGDDSYLGETYHQGASYWLSLGSLYDAKGNDSYNGYHYCQGSAMHNTGAYLFDLAGDDSYAVKVGAAHAIGHDYGTAFFLDRAGNDLYASQDSNPSIGTANGSALFLDAAGDDRYNGPPGAANPARGTGSLGVFVDLGGADLYRTGLADGLASVRPSWGVALDEADPQAAKQTAEPAWPAPGSAPNPGTAEIAALYGKAIQWGVGTAASEVDSSLRKLVAIGFPAWKWMVDEKLKTANRLELRAFTALATRMGAESRAYLIGKVDTAQGLELANAVSVASTAGITELGPKLPRLITDPKTRLAAIIAAGALKAKEAVPSLADASREGGLIMRASMASLAQIGDEGGVPVALALVLSSDPLARRAALSLAGRFPAQAIPAGRELLLDADEQRARAGLQLLGAAGTADSLSIIGESLTDPRAAMRIEALLQLAGRCPEPLRGAFNALRDDPLPAVAAVARGVNPS